LEKTINTERLDITDIDSKFWKTVEEEKTLFEHRQHIKNAEYNILKEKTNG
jgi:hypothetical protein